MMASMDWTHGSGVAAAVTMVLAILSMQCVRAEESRKCLLNACTSVHVEMESIECALAFLELCDFEMRNGIQVKPAMQAMQNMDSVCM